MLFRDRRREGVVVELRLGSGVAFANVLAVAAIALGAAGAWAASPPAPNQKEPANYVAWLNSGFMKRISDNAADKYLAAFEAFKESEAAAKILQSDPSQWTDAQRAALREWVNSNEAALRDLTEAAAKKQCYFELKSDDGCLVAVMMPHYRGMRGLYRAAVARGSLCLLDGDAEGAARDALTVVACARHMESQPVLIASLVGFSMRVGAYELLQRIPASATQGADYARLAARLAEVDPEPRTLSRQFYAEKLMAWDTCQRFLRDKDGDGRCEELSMLFIEDQPGPETLPKPQTFDQAIEQIDRWHSQWEGVFKLEYAATRERIEKIDQQVEQERGTVLGVMAPGLSRTVLIHARMSTERRGTHLVLRLHAYRAKHGQWPAELKAIVPADMPTLVTDPFSGKPFVYRLEGGEPTLYSVGDNGKDDGGQVFRKDGQPAWGETGDFIFWPPPSLAGD